MSGTDTPKLHTANSGAHKNRDLLKPLTSFRFLAALLVFIWHTHLWASRMDPLELGYVGVSFFYVLSGFILTYAYFSKLETGKLAEIKSFYFARIAKLFPVHILMFLFALPLVLPTFASLYPDHTAFHFLKQSIINIGLLQSYFPSNQVNFAFNGVSWSISDELFFYLLLPPLIFILAKYRRRLSITALLASMLAMWALLLIALAPRQAVIDQWSYYIFPLMRLPDFLFGVLLGLIYRQQDTISSQPKWTARTGTIFEVGALCLLIGAVLLSPHLPQSLRFGAMLMPFWGAVIYVFSWQRGFVSKALSVRPLVFLGEISFSFYMCHQLIIRYVANYPTGHKATISLIAAIIMSYCMYLLYEEPARKYVRNTLEVAFRARQFSIASVKLRLAREQRTPQMVAAAADPE